MAVEVSSGSMASNASFMFSIIEPGVKVTLEEVAIFILESSVLQSVFHLPFR